MNICIKQDAIVPSKKVQKNVIEEGACSPTLAHISAPKPPHSKIRSTIIYS